MGISGLLPFLEKASTKVNVGSLANKTVAIDSYCWLHKGAFAVADKLARGEKTDVHILYCLKYVNMLLSHNIKPILVFDGRHLPAKADTEAKRRESRKNSKQKAIELMRKGKHNEARTYLRRCVDITHEMALQLIQACRQINVDCIVAPYEADAQLAYLCQIGIADYVVTEDSDLVLFGCQQILFKMDLYGACTLVEAEKLHLAMGCREDKFTLEKFRFMCILSGCDYVESLPGIGLAKACKFMLKTEESDMMRALDKIPAYLNMRQLTVTEEYKLRVLKANATFQHMVVYDPRLRKQVRMYDPNEIGTDEALCSNAGVLLDDETALNLAVGNLNPFSMKKLDNWHPDRIEKNKVPKTSSQRHLTVVNHPSIWQKDRKNGTNGSGMQQTTLFTTMSASQSHHRPATRQSVRRPLPFIEYNDDNDIDEPQDVENNAELLLNEYRKGRGQPPKKFKADVPGIDAEINTETNGMECSLTPATPTKSRNPFKKEWKHSDDFQSPTKITTENSSLIKNQSPIKLIEYKRPEKLSKFSRTVVSDQQNVISRFFTGAQSNATNNIEVSREAKSTPCETNSPTAKIEMETEPKMEKLDVPVPVPNTLYLSSSGDSAILMNIENGFSSAQDTAGADAQNDTISEKTDLICNLDDLAICISDTEETPSSQMKIQMGSRQLRETDGKGVCRRPGLSLKNSKKRTNKTSATESTSTQSKLSMFGFQKRPQAM